MIVVAGCLLLMATSSCGGEPWSYIADPIDGRVLDKETGQPIESVVVVAEWILATPPEGDEKDFWVLIEAVTDNEGRYHIPGWGPKTRPWSRWLKDNDPALIVFKPGYWLEATGNGDPYMLTGTNPRGTRVRKSYWNGKDFRLAPFRLGQEIEQRKVYESAYMSADDKSKKILMTEEKWAEQISNVQMHVGWGLWHSSPKDWESDEWLKIPNLIKMVYQECIKLDPRLRYRVSSMPEKYRKMILGDTSSCL